MRVPWLNHNLSRLRNLSWLRVVLAFALLVGSVAVLTPSSAAAAGCSAGTPNPQTNNITDYRLDSNAVGPDRWSYQNLVNENAPGLLVKGGSGVFPADEWVADPALPLHALYVKSDGAIGTDWRAIAFAYTAGAGQNGKTLHVSGTWSSGGGRMRILQAHGSTTSIVGPYTTLFTFTGTTTTFDLQVPTAIGDSLLFVSDSQSYWWTPGKLNATVMTNDHPQTGAVTATPDAGAVQKGAEVTLATPTSGACISYTTDGTDPLTSSTRAMYIDPITIDADTRIKAVATAPGQQASAVADLRYVLGTPFRQFQGINFGPTSNQTGGAQWGRMELFWGQIEPVKGQINQAALDQYKQTIATALSNGITMLPVLDYTAPWAANRTGYSYTHHGLTYEFGPVTSESGGNLTRQLVTKDASGAVISTEIKTLSAGNTPPQDVADWERYVRLVVSQVTPLGIKYFQIWNEAHPGSGFWWGGLDQFMQLIHLPAAKIIHDGDGKVVYGGWVCGAPINEYIDVLDRNNAWESMDVFDVHYMPLQAMQTIYDAARKRGIANPAVWQTELGFTPQDEFIADVYPRAFYWAMSQAKSLDQFKLFYFANWSPDDPKAYGYGRALNTGNAPSPKGRTLTTLADLLGGTTVSAYDRFSTSPSLRPSLNESLSSAEGFQVDGKRTVLALHLKRQNSADIFVDWTTGDTMHLGYDNPTVTVTFPDVPTVTKIDRVDLYGNRIPLTWTRGAGNSVQAQVPIIDPDPTVRALNQKEDQIIFYVDLQTG